MKQLVSKKFVLSAIALICLTIVFCIRTDMTTEVYISGISVICSAYIGSNLYEKRTSNKKNLLGSSLTKK